MITDVGNPDIGPHGHAPSVEIEHSELGNPENIRKWGFNLVGKSSVFFWGRFCKNNQMVTFNMADISTAIAGFRHRFDSCLVLHTINVGTLWL